jgi:hypothetical protein
MKSTINQVATYIAFEFGMDKEDLIYILTLLKNKQ